MDRKSEMNGEEIIEAVIDQDGWCGKSYNCGVCLMHTPCHWAMNHMNALPVFLPEFRLQLAKEIKQARAKLKYLEGLE